MAGMTTSGVPGIRIRRKKKVRRRREEQLQAGKRDESKISGNGAPEEEVGDEVEKEGSTVAEEGENTGDQDGDTREDEGDGWEDVAGQNEDEGTANQLSDQKQVERDGWEDADQKEDEGTANQSTDQKQVEDENRESEEPSDTIVVIDPGPSNKEIHPPLEPLKTTDIPSDAFLTPPPSAGTRNSMERKRKRTSITPVVVVETPTKKPAETKVYDTRSSAKKRRELDAAQEESTPVRRGLRTEPEASPYAFRTKTRKGDAIADAGPDEPLSEIVVSPNIIEAKFEASPPPPSKRRKVTRKSESVSPHFPTPTPSEDGPKRTRTRKGSITSPYFSGATETKGTGRAPKGVSIMPWPPFSSDKFGLVQEELLEKPFHLLIATTFLNRTKGSVARPLLEKFLTLYPTPEALSVAPQNELEDFMQPLGLFRIRADRMIKMAKEWILHPPSSDGADTVLYNYPPKDTKPFPISGREPCGVPQKLKWEIAHLPGVGAYALDSWRIFCRDRLRGTPDGEEKEEEEWRRVVPKDKELRAYCRWRWAKEGVKWVEEGDGVLGEGIYKYT